MRRALLTGIAAASLLTAAIGTGAPPAQAAAHHHHKPAKAVVSVLHAVPDTPVDVYVNHKLLINDFQPGTLSPALSLKAGTYTVSITAATAKNDKKPIIGPAKYRFYPGHNYTVVAHLTAAGKPTATRYYNTQYPSGKGKGRLIVRHDAAAPAVDIFANGALTMRHLTNPRQSKINVPAATYSVAVALSGTTAPVIGPADVGVKAKQDTIVYAWGSATAGNLAVAVQTVKTR